MTKGDADSIKNILAILPSCLSPLLSPTPPAVSTLQVFRRELHIASKYGCMSEPKASSHRSIYE